MLREGDRVRLTRQATDAGIDLMRPGRIGTVVNTPMQGTATCQVRWDGNTSTSRYAKSYLEKTDDEEALRLVRSGIINTVADVR